MDSRTRELVSIGDGLFNGRLSLMSYWQQVAEQFYPERSDFLATNNVGSDVWAGLMTSEPVLVRRELANALQAMLRPDSKEWFTIHVTDEELDQDNEPRRWLEWMGNVQRRAMYHPPANFSRAMKEGDNDFVTFGQTALEIDVNRDRTSLLYRCGHLRDHAWSENEAGVIDTVHRKWTPTARQLVRTFRKGLDEKVVLAAEKEPERKFECRRIVLPREEYDLGRKVRGQGEWISIYIDCENDKVIEEYPLRWNPFVIPRWQTVSGSQYAWSPCTGPGLADARALQAVVLTIVEAGQKAVDPPMVATQDAVRSDLALYAGGVTWVDHEYDERLGDALRPVSSDHSGLPFGIEMADRIRRVLAEGFFLNKITLPQDVGKMTAFEVRKRIEEYIRAAAPLLSPAEDEYNGAVCDRTFEVLRAVNAFGPEADIPEALRGQEIRYEFRSPIRDLADEMQGQTLMEAMALLGQVAQIDPAQVENLDLTPATRDSLRGIGVPAKWMKNEKAVGQAKAAAEKSMAMQRGAQTIGGGAQIAEQVGKASQALEQAGLV